MSNPFKVGDIVHRTGRTDETQQRAGMVQGRHYRVNRVDPFGIRVDGAKGYFHPQYFTHSYKTTIYPAPPTKALDVQHGGNHYKKLKIQPVEYIMANGIPYMEGNVIKYISRWRDKGGMQDLKKAKHYIELLIENEEKNNER